MDGSSASENRYIIDGAETYSYVFEGNAQALDRFDGQVIRLGSPAATKAWLEGLPQRPPLAMGRRLNPHAE